MSKKWVEPSVRDSVVDAIECYKYKTGLTVTKLLNFAKLPSSKYYEWKKRYGEVNRHNGKIPRNHQILEVERKAIIEYANSNKGVEGYRRMCYRMLDEDVTSVSPSTVYRVLKGAGLLSKVKGKPSSKGDGFEQPEKVHEHWHMDISYINVMGIFYFLLSIIDGYSRYIINHDLRASMETYDVEIVLQEALEKYPEAKPRLISDNGSQFVSKEFKDFIEYNELSHVRTSVNYPESNGKKERFYQTLKNESVRKSSFLSIEDARKQISDYIEYYNKERLHSAINYLTPEDMLIGRAEKRLSERMKKLKLARERRKEFHKNKKSSLFQYA